MTYKCEKSKRKRNDRISRLHIRFYFISQAKRNDNIIARHLEEEE